jgi:hypothetical protein
MANNISLMQYLQQSPLALNIQYAGNAFEDTTSPAYSHFDITQVGNWATFSLATILHRYNTLLNTPGLILADPMPTSPPGPITSKRVVQNRIQEYLQPRVRRALRSGFDRLVLTNTLGTRTPISYDHGTIAATPASFKPDTAYFDPTIQNAGARPNRAPGDVKPSWKWYFGLRNHPDPTRRKEFKQALSQVNWYMNQHHTQYGYILTNLEFVAIRRLDPHGRLELSAPIPWTAQGTVAHPQLTVLLGLWYLGMLASEDQGALGWRQP